ncbi:NAD(P)/FAD-dependent oxidoreductase [Solirubrobacter taibaiensis]|nr:NAD(P)/FAD-dependent oxidoreductase [Solirubrobacter taibaiensis]
MTPSSPAIRPARGGTLVLGGGFAGAYVARGLGARGATIVNPANFMLYTPLLPEAAAGSIEPRHVTVPLRTMCPHADLLLGSAVALDTDAKVAHVSSEAGSFAVGYERLVIALGAVTHTPEHALPLKTVSDAIRLRNHVMRQIELADADPSQAERRLTFVFAGAGFAGVETLAELQDLAEGALRHHPRLKDVRPRWIAVDSSSRILGQVPESLARFAARTLARRGVEVITGTALSAVQPRAVLLSDGRRIETETVVWTVGVAANPAAARLGLPLDERGRVPVDELFRVDGLDGVFALGDIAAVPNAATGAVDPPTCQHALRQAKRLSKNLRGRIKPYAFKSLGSMATLGRRHGIAVVFGVRLRGVLGWGVARGYHLAALPFTSRRLRVMADWTHAAVFRRDPVAT